MITIYAHTDGWLIIRIFSNIGIQCRFVIKRGHIFSIPFRVKFVSNTNYQNAKISDLMKIEGACHPVISVSL